MKLLIWRILYVKPEAYPHSPFLLCLDIICLTSDSIICLSSERGSMEQGEGCGGSQKALKMRRRNSACLWAAYNMGQFL